MTDQIMRRPRTASGATGGGLGAPPGAPTILLAQADPDARAMIRDALLEGTGPALLQTVATAEELAEYFGDTGSGPRPALVVVDADLPGGRSAFDTVRELKRSPRTGRIPVVLMAQHATPEQVGAAYDAGANTFIARPVTFLALVRLMKVLTAYWLDAAVLPPEPRPEPNAA